MAIAIIRSLRTIGSQAGNLPFELTPSGPMTIAFDIVKKAFKGLSWVHPIDNLGIVLVSAAVVVAMAVVAANVLIALVTAWVMTYAGVFILGFGGGRWTSDMAISYFKAMLGIALELMTVTLLVAIAISVIDGFYQRVDGSSVYELLLVLSVCVVLALLIDKIPPRVAALAGGGSGAGVSAGSIMSGAAMAAAAAATGGAAIAAGAASAAGGLQALTAAFSKAQAAEDAGGGTEAMMNAAGAAGESNAGSETNSGASLASAMGDDAGGAAPSAGATSNASGGDTSPSANAKMDSEGSGQTTSSSAEMRSAAAPGNQASTSASGTSSSGKAGSTTGKVARVAGRTVANLAAGAWDVAKSKANDVRESAAERVADTTGGKIAAAIKARGAVESKPASSRFDGDSLSAGKQPVDADAEVAAFRDRESDPNEHD
ncbi:TrbL/VirB6 plasmid conjugal transfer protein [Duganella phyllosphaerae]|uniref:TrbL/VirB6 plasmid conjugal transfer protein n=2 Tax=Duganella phyllosphaerae TaxID=762836 RepID=A0A1E7WG27_9BURK|nr:TrbL/VirB6 plasmid conjugal transfer protein [Duganella phyllosphaerae]